MFASNPTVNLFRVLHISLFLFFEMSCFQVESDKMARFLSLHVLLIGSVVLYIILGAIVFQMLEGEHLDVSLGIRNGQSQMH